MSWAEVKKINSNLDVPLDECIKENNIFTLDKLGVYKTFYRRNGSGTILTVTGRGRLVWLSIYTRLMISNPQSSLDVLVKIDDKNAISYTAYGPLGSGSVESLFNSGFIPMEFITSSNVLQIPTRGNAIVTGECTLGNSNWFDQSSGVSIGSATSATYNGIRYLKEPIHFENGFYIHIGNAGSNIVRCEYELLE